MQRPDRSEELLGLSSEAVVATLPLVERSAEETVAAWRRRADDFNVAGAGLLAGFPANAIVHAAPKTRSDYWIELAISWLRSDEIGARVEPNDVADLLVDRNVRQSLRQQLKRIAGEGF